MTDIELTQVYSQPREPEVRRPTMRILVGCGILQLPAWGRTYILSRLVVR
jgi:hypothetical protein